MTWSAPVRYAEVDGQGVVFNAHYLLYCDEAMTAYCRARDLVTLAEHVQVVASNLTWASAARWGDVVEVETSCARIGRTSVTLAFDVRVGERLCCHVDTTYVHLGADGRSAPVPDDIRTRLTAAAG